MVDIRGSPSPEMVALRRGFLLVGLVLLLSNVAQSNRNRDFRPTEVSDSDDISVYLDRCPPLCECFVDNRKELWINCTVPYFTPDFKSVTTALSSELTWGLIITCYRPSTRSSADGGMPDSVIWDGVFSKLRHLHLLFLDKCSLRSLKSSGLAGLKTLQTLIIRGARLSQMDRDLITQLPNLQELEISFSAMTKVFPLCESNSLMTINLTGNHLTTMEDTGVFCPPGSLTQLERLDIHNNFITDIPEWVSINLSNLTQLVVADNYITDSRPNSLAFPQLASLDLSNNSFTSFHPRYFEGLRNMLILGLSRNKVNVLPSRLLSNMTIIVQLEISEMGLDDHLWLELFELKRLINLNMSFNDVTSINANIMAQFQDLEYFYAHNNKIRDIPRNAFEKQDNLQILMLSHNEITRVPKLAFSERYALKQYFLDNNNISLIDAAAISGLQQLRILDLSFNRIPYLPIGVFAQLSRLEILDISSNNIDSLGHDNVFLDTKELKYFNASHNIIRQMPKLNAMRYLATVDISHNNLTTLAQNTFLGIQDLKTLLLNRNQLTTLPNRLFKGCDQMRTLDISNNQLVKLGESTFTSTTMLRNVNLSHNKLTRIAFVFRGLTQLKKLDLSFNRLTQIMRNQFPISLEYLYLNNNQINMISDYSFKQLKHIKFVDISANQLVKLSYKAAEIAYGLNPLPKFAIQFNPYVCDCNMGWLKDYADGRLQGDMPLPNLEIRHGFMCRSPLFQYSITAQRIQNLDRSSFLCDYKSHCIESQCLCCDFDSCHCNYKCPSSCQCFIGDAHLHVHHVKCNAAQLSTVPRGLPEGATGLWLDGNEIPVVHKHAFLGMKLVVEMYLNKSQIHTLQNGSFVGLKSVKRLYLQDNFITSLHEITFKGLDKVEEIYLQNNDIYNIEPTSLISATLLVRLNLQNNALISLPVRDLNIFVNRSAQAARRPQLYLSGNQWTCDTEFSCRFLQFLLSHSSAIQDMKYIECIRPLIVDEDVKKETGPIGRLVLDLQRDVCAENLTTPANMTKAKDIPTQLEMYFVIAACVILTFVIILVVICYLNRHFLQVFCFTRFGCRPFKMANAAEDNERPYDAFISYSNKDEDFVIRQLAPRLEKGDKKFKLCVHYRDFPVGACIAETIVRSVEASKRTILVVSDNFLDSEWCRFEFQTAHQQVLNERKNRVILILLHDIDTEKLDSTLKVYMRSRTYLKYDDAWFWEKLMFAMPDIRYRKQHELVPRPSNARDVDFVVRDNNGRVSQRTLRGYVGTNITGDGGVVGVAGVPPSGVVGGGGMIGGAGGSLHSNMGMHPNRVRLPDTMCNDMYEIPIMDSQSIHYQLANGICCTPLPHHTNSAFQPNYNSDTTSGYHNGSVCGSSTTHYEEVGPGVSFSAHTTPQKLIMDTPPPLPRIPQEGFVPRDKMTFV